MVFGVCLYFGLFCVMVCILKLRAVWGGVVVFVFRIVGLIFGDG